MKWCLFSRTLVSVQILHVYEPVYETGGQFWPHIHVRIIASLVFLQVCFIGVFTVKGLGTGTFFVIPLPILTLIFNEHCRQRFFPAFRQFNMEVHSSLFLGALIWCVWVLTLGHSDRKIWRFCKEVLERTMKILRGRVHSWLLYPHGLSDVIILMLFSYWGSLPWRKIKGMLRKVRKKTWGTRYEQHTCILP